MAFVKAASAGDIKPGQGRTVTINGKDIALFNVNGRFFAIGNTCPHRGGPLGEGELDGDVVTCPWHGWRFNVETGISPVNPAAKVQRFGVKVEGSDVLVDIQ